MILEIQKNYSSNGINGIVETPNFWLDQFMINQKLKKMNCRLLRITLESNQKQGYKIVYCNEFNQKVECKASIQFFFHVYFSGSKII